MKQSEVKAGMLVAIRRKDYFGEPRALVVDNPNPVRARRTWNGATYVESTWKEGGILLDHGNYREVVKLAQLVPHADAVAEWKQQEERRTAQYKARDERNSIAAALRAELSAMAPRSLTVDVSQSLTVTVSGSAEDIRKLLVQAAEVGK